MASKHTLQIQGGSLNGLLVAFDSTTNLTQKYSGKATQNPTANRKSVSDHFITNNPVFTLSGVISGVINPNDPVLRDVNETIDRYKYTIENSKLVTFFSGQNRKEKDCFVENLLISKDVVSGLNGWRIDITLNKINVASGGKESLVNIIGDQSSSKTDISSSSTKTKDNIIQVQGIGGRIGFDTRSPVGG